MAKTAKRTRLSPAARRQQLLDVAKMMILEDTLQGFTIEALSRIAGVTPPLIYNYFSSRQVLLQELLQREYGYYRSNLTTQLDSAKNLEAIVRIFVEGNFDHLSPGNILPILQSQPELAEAISDITARDSKMLAPFLVKSFAGRYSLDQKQAGLLVSMSSGVSIAAADYCSKYNVPREQTIEHVMQYIFAGIESFLVTEKK